MSVYGILWIKVKRSAKEVQKNKLCQTELK